MLGRFSQTFYRVGLVSIFCFIAQGIVLSSSPLYSQEFLKNLLTNSPGELSNYHQEWDKVSGCVECHANQLGGEVINDKCLNCHPKIKERLEEERGYHRNKELCFHCHSEHLGKGGYIFAPEEEWIDGYEYGTEDESFTMDPFNHTEDAQWELVGKHKSVECYDCHDQKRTHYKTGKESETTTFLDAPLTCYGCHESDYAHEARPQKWTECNDCHSLGIENWKALRKRMPFDHNKQAKYKLEGLHTKVDCYKCHQPDPELRRVTLFAPVDANQCTDCHYDVHEGEYGTECTECHSVFRKWSELVVSEDKTLDGFDHDKTAFPLEGYHEAVKCDSCHYQEDGSYKFPEGKSSFDECSDCHGDFHGNQFVDQACTDCHAEVRRFSESSFGLEEHNKLDFGLSGKHQVIDCNKCHFSGQYEELAHNECSDCHRNVHPERQIDQSCSFCHVTTDFSWIQFDHNQNTDFDLTGKHRDVACLSCHVNQVFKNMPANNQNPNCQMCHMDPHGEAMANECADCHRTEGFKLVENFDHEAYGYELQGKHAELSCQKCHQQHLLQDYSVPVAAGNSSKDQCTNCHADIHQGANGNNCQSCHNFNYWEVEHGDKVHDLGYFKLQGYHDRMECTECHATNTNLSGVGSQCAWCHEKNDVHLGRLGLECQDCHSQTAWLPVNFRHNTTAFPLTGIHRYVECGDCHVNNIYQGLPNDCYFCHADSYLSNSQIASHGSFQDCADCHTTIDWQMRRRSGVGAAR